MNASQKAARKVRAIEIPAEPRRPFIAAPVIRRVK